jgi:hypothetical protein
MMYKWGSGRAVDAHIGVDPPPVRGEPAETLLRSTCHCDP